MPVNFKKSVFKSGESVCVTIPTPMVKALNIKHKDIFEIWLNDSHIMEKMEPLSREIRTVEELRRCLKMEGYSERVIREILRWYE